ncbi:hypothetical protein ACFWIA_34195 [Streptomyces sp. NPDC127068]
MATAPGADAGGVFEETGDLLVGFHRACARCQARWSGTPFQASASAR